MNAIMDELKELTFIHLHEAFLCANCELIANQMHDGACPACGSKALMSLSRLLGGTVISTAEETQAEEARSMRRPGDQMRAGRRTRYTHFLSRNPSRN